ncbi:DnaJ domain-containing protein [Escherichia coli]|nr:DnaJ domain-containing protein [Escherichia coli]
MPGNFPRRTFPLTPPRVGGCLGGGIRWEGGGFVLFGKIGGSPGQFSPCWCSVQGGSRVRRGCPEQYGGEKWSQPKRGPKMEDACNVLGVKPTDDATTIKRAYRKLMSEHHPDKLVAKGLPPEMMEMAKQKAQEIQQAYELIKPQKGFK